MFELRRSGHTVQAHGIRGLMIPRRRFDCLLEHLQILLQVCIVEVEPVNVNKRVCLLSELWFALDGQKFPELHHFI